MWVRIVTELKQNIMNIDYSKITDNPKSDRTFEAKNRD